MARRDRTLQQQQQRSELVMQSMSRSFSGPIPPPETLEKYNLIIPNAAERILAMAEKQQEHRHDLEKRVVTANTTTQTRGLIAAFIIAMTAVVGGIWVITKGYDASGLATIIAALGSLVGVFVYGRKKQKQDLANKPKPLD